jgi:tRNA(Ile)-lysidine synthase
VALAAGSLMRARRALDEAISQCLVDCASLDGLGVAHVEIGALMSASEEVRMRAMARLLQTVGGDPYTPRLERLTRLIDAIADGTLGRGRTLAGCRILPDGNAGVRLVREAAAIPDDMPVPSKDFLWDRRFRITISGVPVLHGLKAGALTAERWRCLKEAAPQLRDAGIKAPIRATLPVLYDETGLAAVPHLDYRRKGWAGEAKAWFAPAQLLT